MPTESAGYNHFIDQTRKSVKKESSHSFSTSAPDLSIFNNPEEVGRRVDYALSRAIENLDNELLRFENNFLSNTSKILWAADYEDVFYYLKNIFHNAAIDNALFPQVESTVSAKFFQEIGLDHFLSTHHITTSTNRGIRLFYVDTIVSETGSLILNGMSNSALASLNSRGINIFFSSLTHVLSSVGHAEVLNEYRKQCSSSLGCSSLLTKGGRRAQNYLIFVDNRRTRLLADKDVRQALTCISCGKCAEVCPVCSVATPDAYDNVFHGPIANVLLPYLESTDTYRHVAYACTLCGRCEEVCPLHLPLREMMISIRQKLLSEAVDGKQYRNLLKLYRHYVSSRGAVGMNAKPIVKNLAFNSFIDNGLHRDRDIPPFESEPFNKQYLKQR